MFVCLLFLVLVRVLVVVVVGFGVCVCVCVCVCVRGYYLSVCFYFLFTRGGGSALKMCCNGTV